MCDTLLRDNSAYSDFPTLRKRSLRVSRSQAESVLVCERDIFAETALMSRPLFEIKNSILSVARYTRGIVYLVTQATRPANLVTVRQRVARCEIMISQAFPVHLPSTRRFHCCIIFGR